MVDKTERRLAAILAADVAGYTRLVEQDTDGTVAAWAAARDDVVKPLVDEKSGHIIKFTGDGFLVEFPSVQDAVLCAITMQEQLKSSPLDFRMGINVGDIVDDGGDVHGEGVNIAARLEALAEPGGISISGDVYNQVRNRIEADYRDMGEKEIKHVSQLVRVYAIGMSKRVGSNSPVSELPDKPSIAVLPFDNMSGDPEQEYFSDGITEDIITELARFQSLFVIARNSSFAFKGQATDITEIGKKLGVQYVVEGSVRKAGERIRITAQLIDATTGNHLWAERYDRNLADIFAVQDEVASQIVTMVPGHVEIANRVQAERKPTQDMNAYDLMLRVMSITYQDFTSGEEVEQLLKRVLEIDPKYAMAHAMLSSIYAYGVFVDGRHSDENDALAISHAETALKSAPSNPRVHALTADVYRMVGEHALAKYHMDKAISLNPNDFLVMAFAGSDKAFQGDYDGAVIWINKATQSDPFTADAYREVYFEAHFLGGQYELALEQLVGWQSPPKHIYLEKAAALAQLGRTKEAHEVVRQFELVPPQDWNIVDYVNATKRMCARPEDAERWHEGFRKAGLEV
jgi:TolB-like protein/class 3 adenylate cyclase